MMRAAQLPDPDVIELAENGIACLNKVWGAKRPQLSRDQE
jgi:hypothetical protein